MLKGRFILRSCIKKTPSWLIRRVNYSTAKATTRNVIFSGIQPTGDVHIGNYLGALKHWVRLQNDATPDTRLLYSVVDLHALTSSINAVTLQSQRLKTYMILLAIGLDPDRSTIFFQSAVPQHSELMWILSCQAPLGRLSNMTQWRVKSGLSGNANMNQVESSDKDLQLGLLSYPVLQAADILVHRSTHVPVGYDQAQHLEFARRCAIKFNGKHGEVLNIPQVLIAPGQRILSLTDSTKKMSKSNINSKSRINLIDSEEVIRTKIGSALTDSTNSVSYDAINRPGIANLIEIAYLLQNQQDETTLEDFADQYKGLTLSIFKQHISDVVATSLQPIRERYEELDRLGTRYIDDIAAKGAAKAIISAEETMVDVRRKIGLA